VHQITLQVFNFTYLPAMGFLITSTIIVPKLLEDILVPTVNRISRMNFGVIFMVSGLLFISSLRVGSFFSPTDKLVAVQTAQTLNLFVLANCFLLLIW